MFIFACSFLKRPKKGGQIGRQPYSRIGDGPERADLAASATAAELGDAESNPRAAFCGPFLGRHNAHEARVDLLLGERGVVLGRTAV